MSSPKYAPGDNDAPPAAIVNPTLSQAMQQAYRELPPGMPFRWLEARRIAVDRFSRELASLLEDRDELARTAYGPKGPDP